MGNRWGTDRLVAFSDGVFAIAITLLVLDIGVPEADFDDLWQGIADQWPSYFAYVTSFVTIGGLWLEHHSIFRRVATADGNVMRLNLVLLLLVAFLPFPTGLLAASIDMVTAERAAVIFYGLVLLSISVTTGVLWRYLARRSELLEPAVTDREVDAMSALTTPSAAFYVVVVVAAIFTPQVAAVGYLVIAVIGVFRQRGDLTPSSTRA